MSNKSKAVFWNIWGHRYADGIHNFLRRHEDADVFCLTEVTDIARSQIEKNGHNLVYSGDEAAAQVDGLAQLEAAFAHSREIMYDTADYRNWKCIKTGVKFTRVGFGSALLIRDDVFVVKSGVQRVELNHKDVKDRLIQWVIYQKGNTRFLLAHLHGVWIRGNTKGDHELRTRQSWQVRQLLQYLCVWNNVDKVIFGGDLNLHLNTNALAIIEYGERNQRDETYRNLIREYGIRNTRTELYREYHSLDAILYADFAFTSQAVDVHSFQVHNDVLASDHAALVLEFS